MSSETFGSADLRTLSLARPVLAPALLDQYVVYQRALVAGLEEPGATVETLHARALQESGLPPREHGAVAAVCRAFAGQRHTLRHLQARLAEAETAGDRARVERLAPERDRLVADRGLAQRYGDEAWGWLLEREEALVTLHDRLLRAELRPSPAAG